MSGRQRRARRRDEHGAVAVLTAVVTVVLLVAAALAVDLGNTWARRGQLQVQADKAATFAAQYLPARDAAGRLEVAKAAAFYVACNPVVGQRQLHPEIPACPATPDHASLDTYAASLLTTTDSARGRVSVPVSNQVRVLTPTARVDFGLGGAAGADGTDQQKDATARVNSPGMLSPMALSLDCLLNAGAGLVDAGLPFGYISTTHRSPTGPATVTTTWPSANADPQLNGVSPGRVTQQVLGSGPTVSVSGSQWPTLAANQRFSVAFARGNPITGLTQEVRVQGTLVLDAGRNPRRVGSIDVTMPAEVVSVAGEWQVKVVTSTTTSSGTTRAYSRDTSTVDVDSLLTSASNVSCGRLLKSPRGGTQANVNFVLNLQEGLDHLVEQYPTLVSSGPLDLAALRNLVNLTQCGGGGVKDTNGVQPGQVPNCVVTNMSNAYESGFTEGMIGPAGRLTCTTARPCRPGESFSLNGRSLNDDEFTDFVRNPSLLSWQTFFNLDSYLQTGIPVVTPQSNLDRSIYDSHRFMWVAVISTAGATSAVQAGDYPVLSFRPIFITQEEALDTLPLVDPTGILGFPAPTVAAVLDLIDLTLRGLLQPGTTEQRGLRVRADGTLSAVRFMTIAPDALPAVPADYAGAESEYLGVGPRIIRLVE